MNRPGGPRILTAIAVVTMIVAGIGLIVLVFANSFLLDDYAKYGEVPIPGSKVVQLPAGEVTVSFHTVLVGGGGAGLPVPPLRYQIVGPNGVDAVLTEDYGGSTTVNNDARRRIGYLHVPVAGPYDVELDGNVSAFLNPTLAFGEGSSYGAVTWILGAVFGLAVVDLAVARVWAARVRRRARGIDPSPPSIPSFTRDPGTAYAPTDEGIRIEQLKTLAQLRDSGALTQAEYDDEKKRILDGP